MWKYLAALFLIALFVGSSEGFRKQRVGIKGRFLCGDEALANIEVKLQDYDTGPDPDDTLDQGRTSSSGYIELAGDTRELTSIDPVIKVWHFCSGQKKPCKRLWRREIPKKYINKKVDERDAPFNLGTVQFELDPVSETSPCL